MKTKQQIGTLLRTGEMTGGVTDPEGGDVIQIRTVRGEELDLHLDRTFGDRLPSDSEILESVEGIATRGGEPEIVLDTDEVRIAMTHGILDKGLSPMQALAMAIMERGADVDETAELMTEMTGKTVSVGVVASYITKARRKQGLPDRRYKA